MIHVGTSGFFYKHWKGIFYPDDVPQRKWLEYYTTVFDCVEINSSFYHLPKETVVASWYDRVPEKFVFVVKGSRTVTHVKRLKDCKESVTLFYERMTAMKEKPGAVLWQLPPGLHLDLARLDQFLKRLPEKPIPVLEFRHQSWFVKDVIDLLSKKGAVFCIHDMESSKCPRKVTVPMFYVRFHGVSGKYSGNYPDDELKSWAQWIASSGAIDGYVFFNNDFGGFAVQNAMTLRRFLKAK
jgi:uncharacterized protein YecE (DUF72 family)